MVVGVRVVVQRYERGGLLVLVTTCMLPTLATIDLNNGVPARPRLEKASRLTPLAWLVAPLLVMSLA